jgi:hypothetical protein
MATKEPTPPEGFERVDPSGSDDGEQYETKELDPGDSLQGRVIDILDGEGDYGPWYRLRLIDTETGEIFDYFAEDDVKKAVTQGDLTEGDQFYAEKETTDQPYDIDGRKGTYYPVGCWIGGA